MIDFLRWSPIRIHDLHYSDSDINRQKRRAKMTYAFPLIKIIFPFPTVAFEFRTHILTSSNKSNGFRESFRFTWIIHLARPDRHFSFFFSLFYELISRRNMKLPIHNELNYIRNAMIIVFSKVAPLPKSLNCHLEHYRFHSDLS